MIMNLMISVLMIIILGSTEQFVVLLGLLGIHAVIITRKFKFVYAIPSQLSRSSIFYFSISR